MQGWKTENCSSLPETLEMVNANTYIQRRNINRIERDSMDGSEEKEVGYTCEYRFLSEEEYYNLIQQEENTEKVNENILISMGALKTKVETNREMITFSKFLATIKIDVPIQLDMDSLVREQADEDWLRQIFEELEFRTLIDRVLKKENA